MTRRFPTKLGQYQLLELVGEGGMAEVFLARPPGGRRLLAIKRLKPSLTKARRHVRMFIHEGNLAVRLEHDAIVRSHRLGKDGDDYFICMDYLPGVDLSRLMDHCHAGSEWILPVPHATYIALRVCEGLHFAHELTDGSGASLRLVNRDVSPSNIRITFDGEVKLLDFGIAKATSALTSEIGGLAGKVSHMSPEQVRSLPLDRRSDVFSTSIVLHEMLVGERLFRHASQTEQMEAVRRAEVPLPSSLRPRIAPELDTIVMRGLSKDPRDRYPTCQEMADDLQRILAGYDFSPAELREFVRSRCANEWASTRKNIEHHRHPQTKSTPRKAIPQLERSQSSEPTPTPLSERTTHDHPSGPNQPVATVPSHHPWWIFLLLALSGALLLMAVVLAVT